ncbi:hypothetical protein [Lysinibacillus sp. TE18511]
MTTKTTYKVGDKVRILDAENIYTAVKEGFKTGRVYEVESIDSHGDPLITNGENTICFFQSELQYIEKVEESDAKMTKFKVGDKVRVVAESHGWGGVSKGDEGVIKSVDGKGRYQALIPSFHDNITWAGEERCFELAPQKPTKKQRITTLEQKVEAMQAEIDALKAAQKPKSILSGEGTLTISKECDTEKIAARLAEAIKGILPKSANEKRKAIIDEAKAFVEKYSGVVKVDTTPYTTGAGSTTVKLFVNKEKRIVTAIPHLVNVNYTVHNDKKFAKCNPSDVFNADIGKAIALGRALGIDVSKFEKAVQPSEVVEGMVVIHTEDEDVYTIEGVYEGNRYDMRHTDGEYFGKYRMTDSIENFYDILNDSEAQY